MSHYVVELSDDRSVMHIDIIEAESVAQAAAQLEDLYGGVVYCIDEFYDVEAARLYYNQLLTQGEKT